MFQTIMQALERGQPQEALRLAEAAVAAQPDNPEVLQTLALVLRSTGELSSAARHLDRAIELAPERAGLYLSRAATRLGLRRNAEAEADLETCVRLDPNQLGAYLLRAQIALSARDYAEAERQLRLAQRVEPDNPRVQALEGLIASSTETPEVAEQRVLAALKKRPNDAGLLVSLGMAYLQRNANAFAAQAFERALAVSPSMLDARRGRVEALRRDQRHEDMVPELDALVEANPDDQAALAQLAESLFRSGQLNRALEQFGKLLDRDSDANPSADVVARVLVALGARESAVTLIEARLEAGAGERLWGVRLSLAAADTAERETVVARWLERYPESITARELRVQLLEAAARFDIATKEAQALLADQPESVAARLVLLRARLRDDPEAALAMLDAAPQWPGQPVAEAELAFWRGQALDRLDRHQQALDTWLARAEAVKGRGLPVLRPAGPTVEPAEDGLPVLLWGAPGARAEWVASLLQFQPMYGVVDDRIGGAGRPDGFSLPADGSDRVPDRAEWARILERAGLPRERIVDWVPHADALLYSQIPGGRVLVAMCDPRDMLLNWLVFGSAQGFGFPGLEQAADWLAGTLEALADARDADPEQVCLVDIHAIESDLKATAAQVGAFLRMHEDAFVLPSAPRFDGVGGLPVRVSEGHWKAYAALAAAAFERLEAVARRLGY